MPAVALVMLTLLAPVALLLVAEAVRPGGLLRLVDFYLDLFAGFASRDREYVRLEHRAIGQSLRYAYADRRSSGSSHLFAVLAALVEHLSELQPFALAGKTRSDDVAAQTGAATHGCDRIAPLPDTVGWRVVMIVTDAVRGMLAVPSRTVLISCYVAALVANALQLGFTTRWAGGALLTTALAALFLAMLVARRDILGRFSAAQHRVEWQRAPGRPDWLLVAGLGVLVTALGAQALRQGNASALQLTLLLVIGVLVAFALKNRYEQLQSRSPLFMLGTILALALVLVPGVGAIEHSRAVLRIGSLVLEPASFAAIAVVLYVAAWITSRSVDARSDLVAAVRYISMAGLVAGLLLLQLNLSVALMVGAVVASMFVITGVRWSLLVATLSGCTTGLAIMLLLHADQLPARVQPAFLGGNGQSEFALVIPAALAFVVWRGFRLVSVASSPFGAVLAGGISAWFGLTGLAYGASVWGLIPAFGPFSVDTSATALAAPVLAAVFLISISTSSTRRTTIRAVS